MEKKTGNVSPGKTYVVRFKPSGSTGWSKTYEFTVPKITLDKIEAATARTQSSKITTTVRTNTNKTWGGASGVSYIYFDVADSNDYGLWDYSTDSTRIKCPFPGWYTATLYTPFSLFTSLGAYNSKVLTCTLNKFRPGRDLLPAGQPESLVLSQQSINTNGMYTLISTMSCTNTSTFYIDNSEEYITADVAAFGGSGGAGSDSKGTLASGATLTVTYLGV